MNNKLNIEYCNNQCQKGIEARKNFLTKNDSVYDAVSDFQAFTTKCFETCPFKAKHIHMKEN